MSLSHLLLLDTILSWGCKSCLFGESGLGAHHSVAAEVGRPAHGGWDGSLAETLGCMHYSIRALLFLCNPDTVWPVSSSPCYFD